MAKDFVLAQEIALKDSATLTGGYDTYTILMQPCFMLRFINNSNTTVEVSYDGIHTHEIVRANSDVDLPGQVNSQPNNQFALFRRGMQIWLLGAAGIGNIYMAGYYQETI